MDDSSVARFWDKYISKTTAYGVKRHQAYWYVRHAEAYIKSVNGVRLSEHTSAYLESYLAQKYDKGRLQGWHLEQIILALKILFTDMVKASCKQTSLNYTIYNITLMILQKL